MWQCLLHSNFLSGCVYLPHESSKYSSEEAFIEIENEMIQFSNNHSNIVLVGDSNARSGKLYDIVEIDEDFFDILDIADVADFVSENKLFCHKLLKKRYSCKQIFTR